MREWRVLRGRIERWAAHYHGPRFHALLCDPPYEFGFMGRDWDKSGVSFNPETWVALAEHLYPGAFGMAFASSRGWHRLACAIEDAGLIIHPTVWKYWSYGSGFPKATRIDTQVDAAAGAKRRVVGKIVQPGSTNPRIAMGNGWQKEPVITAPATPLAAAWEGHRYGLQAIKPAVEPIVVFAKSKTLCYNVLQEVMTETSNLLEELWQQNANEQSAIINAAQEVNTILSKVLGSQDLTYRASGLNVETAERLSTNRLEPCDTTVANADDTVVANATLNTAINLQDELASNAEKGLPQTRQTRSQNTVAEVAPILPADAPCWKTLSAMGIDTDTAADILRCNSERARFDLSMIWLWSIILDGVCEVANKSTTATAEKMITELRILNYSLQRLTQENRNTESTRSSSEVVLSYAQDVERKFVGLLMFPKERESIAQNVLSPIIVFQKPYEGRPVESIVETGAGALWIDGGRIGTKWQRPTHGRWPANLCLVHHSECRRAGSRQVRGNGTSTSTSRQFYSGGWGSIKSVEYRDADGLETIDDWECHADCPVRALGGQSGERPHGCRPNAIDKVYEHNSIVYGNYTGEETGNSQANAPCDFGTAARFFFQADWALEQAEPVHCALCLQPITKHGIMNETQEENMPCNANGAEESLSPPDESSDSVPTVAQQPGLLDGAGRSGKSSIPASSVEKSSSSTPETIESSAPRNAELTLAERCALSVKSVVSLCDSCATAIAQRLAQMLHDHAQGLPLSPVFTEEPRQQILFLSLVQSVASLDSSDTTRIMQSQKRLNGFVIHAIRGSTKSTELQSLIPLPFHESVMEKLDTAEPVFYQSKAGRAERDAGCESLPLKTKSTRGDYGDQSQYECSDGAQRVGNKRDSLAHNPHPTVKPLSLCKWLATLLLPPQEYAPRRILVPFAGSGSEMIGALLADWEWILGIEMLAENVALAEARLAWWADKSRWGQTDPVVLLREREPDDGQLELWSV